MPLPDQTSKSGQPVRKFTIESMLFGPIRPAEELNRRTTTALKSHSSGRDYYSEITLQRSRQGPNRRGMQIEYSVNAKSPENATRVGLVYLSQLCDLISSVTQCPIWFCMPEDDARDEHIRMNRRTTSIERELTEEEWLWITGHLAHLRRKHPRFLASASWYRKGLLGRDSLDDFCCFWRSIERLGLSYADKTEWDESERNKSPTKRCITQLALDLFSDDDRPEILKNDLVISQMYKLRCEISHGNVPITPELISVADEFVGSLENAAFRVLTAMRAKHLVLSEPE